MPKFLNIVSVLAALSLAGAAYAQDSTETPAADAATDTPAESADPGLSLGEEVAVEPYIREASGDWNLECLRTGTDEEPCQLMQELNGEDGTPIATVRMFRLKNGGEAEAGAMIAVPLETLLTAQLTIAVDSNPGKRYPFSVCDRLGCYARIGFRAEDIAEFKRGAKATLSIVPFVAPDQRVLVDMSLKGFTAGYDMVTEVEAQ
ncbi:Invasion protein B, involved in pathogenesis [Thalassovita gelatinovora]|uniref:Invasion protein B, involved in pathogenesis n=1 Tax=Thalassovita gelatinovora TaxID=53501 RepID=A0A0N7LU88_THAGE|nr:invasion associated locus B family protein [Thalassovita gelatinovora]QIZ79449.1 invasion associated locus B family protein [Thalassovita gelatinovora]CUH62818.1 Invasion protein B, involved in pathogenesis [Thalassovita gelatinovora]SEQ10748.1 Invasion protein IalB, involved in pathogenesis [Thalassovita gelatinovora]